MATVSGMALQYGEGSPKAYLAPEDAGRANPPEWTLFNKLLEHT